MGTKEDISPDESVVRILSECRVSLFAEARRYCDDVGDAEELVLRTMDAALRDWESCKSKEDPLSWLFGILRNIRSKDIRRIVNRNTVAIDPNLLAGNDSLVTNETDDAILRNSDSDVVRAAIERLAPEFRKTVVMHYMMDMSLSEIAMVLKRPIGTVKWRLSVAKSVLAERLRRSLGRPGTWLALALGLLTGCIATVMVMRMPSRSSDEHPKGGMAFNTPKVHGVTVRHAPKVVKIDGSLGEWSEPVFEAACNPPYDRDYTASMRMMWDEKHLYIAGDVRTPDPMRNNTEAVDGYRFAGGSVICRLSAEEKIISLVMYCDRISGRESLCFHKGVRGHQGVDIPRGLWQGAYSKHCDGRGYAFEYAIEWAAIGMAPPKPGEARPNTWNIHFSDSVGEACSGQMVENVAENIPESYGNMDPITFYMYPLIWGTAVFE